jgi:hypothetical protein
MSYPFPGVRSTLFGRVAVAETSRFDLLHFWRGEELQPVDHESPVPVLDQEDLDAQGIDTSQVVVGAPKVDALGSCTANASVCSLGERLATKAGAGRPWILTASTFGSLNAISAITDEEFAIRLYHVATDATGNTSTEWPPQDCGSSGLAMCQTLQSAKLIKSYASAANIQSALHLLQTGTVIMGSPWFNMWMQPDAQGYVDGDGSQEALDDAIDSGVAGGHETCFTAMITAYQSNLTKVVIRVRNSWSKSWGLGGSYLIHASTLAWLGNQCDYKQFVV